MAPAVGRSNRALIKPKYVPVKKDSSTSRVLKGSVNTPAKPMPKRMLRCPASVVTVNKSKEKARVVKQPPGMKSTRGSRVLASRLSFQPEVGKLARSNKMTILERRSVTKGIEEQYNNYDQKFLSFCQEQGLEPPPSENTDANLAGYMDVLFFEGRPMNEGEKIVASLEYHHVKLKGRLVRSRRALRGWRKECPPESRIPLPKLIVYGMCMILLSKGKRLHALKLILDFDTYMRPGESQDLLAKNLVAPVARAGPQYKWYAVVIRDFDEKRPDKVGVYDNSVPLNSPTRKWIGPILHSHVKTLASPTAKMFPFSGEEYRKEFTKAAEMMNLKGLHPYQLRHGGAADDLNSKERDYQSVKTRGRWQTDQSVRRYTKVGKIQQLLNQLSSADMEYCRWSLLNLEKVLKGTKPARMNRGV
jgi:hypothetical protein